MSTPFHKADITVLMPVYNASDYLVDAIDSILRQTFSNFKFLIINDGSTDKSEQIIKSYSDSRIRYIKNESNIGLVATLNKGISVVDTEFIARMDADDISVENRLEIQFNLMRNNPEIGVCSSSLERFGKESVVWNYPLTNNEIKASLLFQSSIAHAVSIIRTHVLKENNIRYRDIFPHMEDYDLWFQLKDLTEFKNLPNVLYKYRVADKNVTVLNANTQVARKMHMYRFILSKLLPDVTDEQISLHYGFGKGGLPVTDENILKYKEWLTYLLVKNSIEKQYPQLELNKFINMKWDQLFYQLPPYGFKILLTYFYKSKKVSFKHLNYLAKFKFNKILGRKRT